MDISQTQEPLEWLVYLQRLCARHAAGLPQQQQNEEEWSGIGFRVGSLRLVSPLGDIIEILSLPQLTRVPGTKDWIRGIANVRGNIMPIVDIHAFLYGSLVESTKHARVLVINHNGICTGLVVDAVLGLQHFGPEHVSSEHPTEYDGIERYLTEGFQRDGDLWRVFSMQRLAETAEFIQAAV